MAGSGSWALVAGVEAEHQARQLHQVVGAGDVVDELVVEPDAQEGGGGSLAEADRPGGAVAVGGGARPAAALAAQAAGGGDLAQAAGPDHVAGEADRAEGERDAGAVAADLDREVGQPRPGLVRLLLGKQQRAGDAAERPADLGAEQGADAGNDRAERGAERRTPAGDAELGHELLRDNAHDGQQRGLQVGGDGLLDHAPARRIGVQHGGDAILGMLGGDAEMRGHGPMRNSSRSPGAAAVTRRPWAVTPASRRVPCGSRV